MVTSRDILLRHLTQELKNGEREGGKLLFVLLMQTSAEERGWEDEKRRKIGEEWGSYGNGKPLFTYSFLR